MLKLDSSEDVRDAESTIPTAVIAEVHVYSNTEFLKKYAIEHGEYIVGRDSSCHIVVEAESVSRHHARLSFSAYELIIEDLGLSNGVFIDGVQVMIPTRLRNDQEVQIGAARLIVRLSPVAAAQLSAALSDEDLGLAPMREMLAGQKYKIITTIGRGGMGVVMQGRDLRIRRTVAVKVMKSDHQFSRENVLRFVNEAQLTGQLEHPNIVPIYELGTDEHGEAFYTMKYVRGITLEEVLRGLRNGSDSMVEKYPLGTLLTIFQKICDAVAFAHSKGVVHRDLKPDNVMIGAFGEVLVMDWGLAKNLTGALRGSEGIETELSAEESLDARGFQTMHGLIVGTPPYISPEQARGSLDEIDARSDVYVLGELLYAILTLRPPFGGSNVQKIVEAILSSKLEPPSSFNAPPKSASPLTGPSGEEFVNLLHLPGRRVPDGLSAVVMKAMQLAPEDRYQTVGEMQADIAAHQGGFAPKAERASLKKHILLWAGRHKGEVALFLAAFVFITALAATFIYRLSVEKNSAKVSAEKAIESQRLAEENGRLAAARLNELRGTAPTYYKNAQSLLAEESFVQALEEIEYAIRQVPNEPDYHVLRGYVLQSLLRWDEAHAAFEEALRRNPEHADAKLNLAVTERLMGRFVQAGDMTPAILGEFLANLLKQGRSEEARALLPQIPKDRELFRNTWRSLLDKRGFKHPFECNDDETINVDLARISPTEWGKLVDTPLDLVTLDDSRITDLGALRRVQMRRLSLNRTPVSDLAPLGGKKLVELSVANCPGVRDISPLRGTSLRRLNLSRTGVRDLGPLAGAEIIELNLQGCTDVKDLRPLLEMPKLEAVIIPTHCKDIEFLRAHPSLRYLSYKKMTQPADEFWRDFDGKK